MYIKFTITIKSPIKNSFSRRIFYKKGQNLGELRKTVKYYSLKYGKENVEFKVVHQCPGESHFWDKNFVIL